MEPEKSHAHLLVKDFFPLDLGKHSLKPDCCDVSKSWTTKLAIDTLKRDADKAKSLNRLIESVGSKRDKNAFDQLFQYFSPRLKSFSLRQGSSAQVAEEIAQETMINVWRKAHQFDSQKASASTWVFTIARNRRIDLLRKTNRPEPDPNDPAFIHDSEIDSGVI